MNTKALSAVMFGFKLLSGISAGYLMDRLMEKKVNELVDEGGMLNAAVVGAGQGAIDVAVGLLVYAVI